MSFAAAIFTSGMLAAAASDLLRRRIPNWMNLAILFAGLGVQAVDGGSAALAQGLLGAGAGLLLLLPLFHFRWIGGGDVKMVAAIGAWMGPTLTFWTTLIGLAGGGLLALVITATGGQSLRGEVAVNLQNAYLSRSVPEVARRGHRQLVPMAVAFAGAAIGAFAARGGF
jgi:prepilin peptidase CpaA